MINVAQIVSIAQASQVGKTRIATSGSVYLVVETLEDISLAVVMASA